MSDHTKYYAILVEANWTEWAHLRPRPVRKNFWEFVKAKNALQARLQIEYKYRDRPGREYNLDILSVSRITKAKFKNLLEED